MRTQKDMKNDFRKGFEKFLQSEKNVEDYTMLFVAFRNSTNFGSGLMFGQIEEIMDDILNKNGEKEYDKE